MGNKIDLEEERVVLTQEAQTVAEDIGISYVETSAKTYSDTRVAFEQLIDKILKRTKKGEAVGSREGKVEIGKEAPGKKKDDCC